MLVRSVKFRLTLWYVGTVTVLLCLFVYLDYSGLKNKLLSNIDSMLLHGAKDLENMIENSDGNWHLASTFEKNFEKRLKFSFLEYPVVVELCLIDDKTGEKNTLYSSGSIPYEFPDGYTKVEVSDTTSLYQYRSAQNSRQKIHAVFMQSKDRNKNRFLLKAAISTSVVYETLEDEMWEHIFLSMGLIVIISVFGIIIIGRVLLPVKNIVKLTRNITADDLSRRIEPSKTKDEIGELIDTLNEMIARLEQSFEQVKQFSGDVSHELNTPITILKGEIELALKRERSAEEYRQTLLTLAEETNRLGAIVEDLLFLSHMDIQGHCLKMETVNLDEVVLQAHEETYLLADIKNVSIQIDAVEELKVEGDFNLIKRMFINIITNAIKFSDDGGNIKISLSKIDGKITFTVEDNGIGIEDKDLKKIFERFYRADKSRSKETGGSGLGLAIADRISQLHGCYINVQSEAKKGSKFSVCWG